METNSLRSAASKYFQAYKDWIIANPQLIGDIESIVRWLSYFTAGRVKGSALVSEFVYSLPNLLVLFNDRLVWNSRHTVLKLPKLQSRIKVWLTVVEYTEALFEVSSNKLWGDTGKWMVILILQSLKATMRLLLVYKFEERITQNPPIPPLDREKLNTSSTELPIKDGFQLKRSGTVVRTINSASPVPVRTWAPICSATSENAQCIDNPSSKKAVMLAETLYIMKPLLHLGCLSISGQKQWKPWFLSFLIDLASLRLLSREAKIMVFTKEEKEEICRRRLSLLLYILRSPFYDNYSRVKINSFLNLLSTTIPLARLIAEPVAKYLPHWQNTYFYMWSC